MGKNDEAAEFTLDEIDRLRREMNELKRVWDSAVKLLDAGRKREAVLVTALANSDSLLRTLGTHDDPVVQTALAENAKALNKTDGE